MVCVYDLQTTYSHQIWFANLIPIAALGVSAACFALLKVRPQIGDRAQRPVGQAMTNERMERDWLLLEVIKESLMVVFLDLPAVS